MDYNALENMTVHKLREEAKKFPDIKGTTGMKKEELIGVLADKLGIVPTEKKPKKPKKSATPMNKNTIKKKLMQLREERDTARSGGDSKKTALLRRRIHSLKRRMRKIDQK